MEPVAVAFLEHLLHVRDAAVAAAGAWLCYHCKLCRALDVLCGSGGSGRSPEAAGRSLSQLGNLHVEAVEAYKRKVFQESLAETKPSHAKRCLRRRAAAKGCIGRQPRRGVSKTAHDA